MSGMRLWVNDWNQVKIEGDTPPTDEDALRASILKWTAIRDWLQEHEGQDYDLNPGGPDTCGLCLRHYKPHLERAERCRGCPVMAKTGRKFCAGTPAGNYEDLERANYEDDDPGAFDHARIGLAQAEIDFLTRLLKERLAIADLRQERGDVD